MIVSLHLQLDISSSSEQKQPFLLAEAFVTPTDSSNIHRNQQFITQSCPSSACTSTTALHFFFQTPQNAQNDLPLARYVDVSANYTLAETREDYLPLGDGQRLVCIGDVHGDYKALQDFLQTAGVYDPTTDAWVGGNTIVVQCGDILDRGMEELACYQLLSKLSQQAIQQHGKVILLIGNHEALNAMGLFQYAFSDIEHEQCIGQEVDRVLGPENQWRNQYVNNQPARWASYEPGGLLAHSLLRNMKVAVKVGKTVCVHAGLKASHLKDHGGIEGMNAAYREWISLGDDLENAAKEAQQQHHNPNVNHVTGVPLPPPRGNQWKNNPIVYNHHGRYPPDTPRQPWIDAEQRQRFYVNTIPTFLQSNPNDPGPIWMRDYSSPHDAPPKDPVTTQQTLDETLVLLGADRMVMGHTIQSKINGILGGKAWRVDVGASKGCLGGTPEVLEISCGRTHPDAQLIENVAILQPPGRRIPATERLVDAYTQAALQMF